MKNKKIILAAMYCGALALVVMVSSSCDDGPITPNEPIANGVDTTWVDPYDTLGGNGGGPNDTIIVNPGGGNGGNPMDTTGTGGFPNDSIGG